MTPQTPDTDNVLTPENFFAKRTTPPTPGVNPNAPTGDPFVDLMLGKGAKQPDPGKWRIPVRKAGQN